MKNLILSLILFTFTVAATAQTSNTGMSNAEIFANKTGAAIQNETFEIGSVGNAYISVKHYTDLNTNVKVSALVLTFSRESTGGKSFTLYVDPDEVIGLSRCIKTINESTTKTNTHVNYRTRGGGLFEIWYSKNNNEEGLRCAVTKNEGNGTFDGLSNKEFETLCNYIEMSKIKLIYPESVAKAKKKK